MTSESLEAKYIMNRINMILKIPRSCYSKHERRPKQNFLTMIDWQETNRIISRSSGWDSDRLSPENLAMFESI